MSRNSPDTHNFGVYETIEESDKAYGVASLLFRKFLKPELPPLSTPYQSHPDVQALLASPNLDVALAKLRRIGGRLVKQLMATERRNSNAAEAAAEEAAPSLASDAPTAEEPALEEEEEEYAIEVSTVEEEQQRQHDPPAAPPQPAAIETATEAAAAEAAAPEIIYLDGTGEYYGGGGGAYSEGYGGDPPLDLTYDDDDDAAPMFFDAVETQEASLPPPPPLPLVPLASPPPQALPPPQRPPPAPPALPEREIATEDVEEEEEEEEEEEKTYRQRKLSLRYPSIPPHQLPKRWCEWPAGSGSYAVVVIETNLARHSIPLPVANIGIIDAIFGPTVLKDLKSQPNAGAAYKEEIMTVVDDYGTSIAILRSAGKANYSLNLRPYMESYAIAAGDVIIFTPDQPASATVELWRARNELAVEVHRAVGFELAAAAVGGASEFTGGSGSKRERKQARQEGEESGAAAEEGGTRKRARVEKGKKRTKEAPAAVAATAPASTVLRTSNSMAELEMPGFESLPAEALPVEPLLYAAVPSAVRSSALGEFLSPEVEMLEGAPAPPQLLSAAAAPPQNSLRPATAAEASAVPPAAAAAPPADGAPQLHPPALQWGEHLGAKELNLKCCCYTVHALACAKGVDLTDLSSPSVVARVKPLLQHVYGQLAKFTAEQRGHLVRKAVAAAEKAEKQLPEEERRAQAAYNTALLEVVRRAHVQIMEEPIRNAAAAQLQAQETEEVEEQKRQERQRLETARMRKEYALAQKRALTENDGAEMEAKQGGSGTMQWVQPQLATSPDERWQQAVELRWSVYSPYWAAQQVAQQAAPVQQLQARQTQQQQLLSVPTAAVARPPASAAAPPRASADVVDLNGEETAAVGNPPSGGAAATAEAAKEASPAAVAFASTGGGEYLLQLDSQQGNRTGDAEAGEGDVGLATAAGEVLQMQTATAECVKRVRNASKDMMDVVFSSFGRHGAGAEHADVIAKVDWIAAQLREWAKERQLR